MPLEHDDSETRRRYARVQLECHAARARPFERVVGQGSAQLRQNAFTGVNEHDAQIVRGQVWVIREHSSGEIIQRAHQFGTGEATAGDNKR